MISALLEKKDSGATHRLYSVRPAPPPPALVRADLHAVEDVGAVTGDAGGLVFSIVASIKGSGRTFNYLLLFHRRPPHIK